MNYTIFEYEDMGKTYVQIIRNEDNGDVWYIPADEANADYQQYLIDTDGGLPIPEETVE